jgi:PAS domain S-box-containing protein
MTNDTLQLLRRKAEQLLAKNGVAGQPVQHLEVSRLFQELQVYQLELEMQVEELRNISGELEVQKKKFQHLFNAAPVGYLVVNKRGNIRDANKMVANLLRQEKQMLISKPFSTFILPDDIDRYYVFLHSLQADHQQQQCNVRVKSGKNDYIDVQLSAISLDIDELERYSYITLTDITENQQAQLKLFEVNQRLALALEASSTGIWEVDTHTAEIILDENSQGLLGLRAFDFKGNLASLLEYIHPDDRNNFEDELRRSIISGNIFHHIFRSPHSSGEWHYIQARAKRIDTGSPRFIGTMTDITERKQLEEETRNLKEKQQQAVTAAAIAGEEKEKRRVSEALHNGVGQLLYGLKLLIGPLNGSQPEIYPKINKLLSQAILDTRNISHELAPSTLVDFGLEAALEEMAERFGDQVNFDLKVFNIAIKTDPSLMLSIYRMVQELVNNSIRHGQADHISIGIERIEGIIKIIVADNGCGFDPHNAEKFGNGIASIKNRLSLYNGNLQIESAPQKGTKVEVELKQFPG